MEDRLKKIDQPFEASQLYSSLTETKFVDESLRRSAFRAMTDPSLLQIAAELVANINSQDPLYNYQLVPNNVTQIVYSQGGFFQRHQDFLSLVSNVIEEFTMIVCITPSDMQTEGGETAIHLSPAFKHISAASTQRGSALVFRKDLPHEGCSVRSGEKHIVTLNLWATRKNCDDRVLHVVFASASALQAETKVTAGPERLLKMATHPTSYALSFSAVLAFPESLLARKIHFEQAQTSSARSHTMEFVCDSASYDQFATIYRVYNRCQLSLEEVQQNGSLLKFFGLADEHLLVAMAGPNSEADDRAVPVKPATSTSRPSMQEFMAAPFWEAASSNVEPKQNSKQSGATTHRTEQLDSSNSQLTENVGPVIVCASREDAFVVAAAAKTLGLPYIPFQMWFVEGVTAYGGEMADVPEEYYSMLPVWCSIGHYDNIVGIRRLMQTNGVGAVSLIQGEFPRCVPAKSLQVDKLLHGSVVTLEPNYGMEEKEPSVPDGTVCYDPNTIFQDPEDVVSLGAHLAFVGDITERITAAVWHGDVGVLDGPATVLPGCSDIKGAGPESAPFHYDSFDKSCFTATEAATAVQIIKRLDLVKLAQNAIQSTRFVLPQHLASAEHHFCNENVYTFGAVLRVSGVVRLVE